MRLGWNGDDERAGRGPPGLSRPCPESIVGVVGLNFAQAAPYRARETRQLTSRFAVGGVLHGARGGTVVS